MSTDYFPPIQRAVAGLPQNAPEARKALYDRARAALVKQLRGMDPPLSEAQFTKERLMLEEAIRRVEAEASIPAAPGSPKAMREVRNAVQEARELGSAAANMARSARSVLDPEAGLDGPVRIEPRLGPASDMLRLERPRAPGPRREEGTSRLPKMIGGGLAVVVLVAGGVGGAYYLRQSQSTTPVTAAAQPPAPAEPAAPASGKLTDRLGDEPGAAPAPPKDTKLAETTVAADPKPSGSPDSAGTAPAKGAEAKPAEPAVAEPAAAEPEGPPAVVEAPAIVPKRAPVSATAEPLAPAAAPAKPSAVAAVAQRATLYEEDPDNPQQGRTFPGTIAWRTESVAAASGAALETAIKGEIEIPERKLKVQLTIRRNSDAALPATHTVEVQFAVPTDFPNGGIQNVPGILMKDQPTVRGAPLSGLSVRVTSGFFLVGLNNLPAEGGRNEQLLKDRAWIDLPMLYDNGRRAILTIEKGVPGDKAFADAFESWGTTTGAAAPAQ